MNQLHAEMAYNSLDNAQKAFFQEVQNSTFSKQAIAFLDAYWDEIGSQAPFIFEVAWEVIKEVDMQMQNCIYLHLYKESSNLADFDWALLFFEKLCKAVEERKTEDRDAQGNIVIKNNRPVMKRWCDIAFFNQSMPTMMTAVTRRQELKEKVDFNNDGTISFLEYLIYTYKRVSNAADFIIKGRALAEGSKLDSPERRQLALAQQALDDVKKKIAEYQAAMARLQQIIKDHDDGVLDEKGNLKVGRARKGKALFELEELKNSGLAAELKKALIDAEYKVKVAMKQIRDAIAEAKGRKAMAPGAMFWVEASVQAEKRRAAGYGIAGLVAQDKNSAKP